MRHNFILVLIMGVGIVITTIAYQWYKQQSWDTLNADFKASSSSIGEFVDDKFDLRLEELRSIARYYYASQHVTRDEYRLYTSDLLSRDGGFKALMWAPKVMRHNRENFEKTISEELRSPYEIRDFTHHSHQAGLKNHKAQTSTERHVDRSQKKHQPVLDFLTPVLFIEPFDKKNRVALGFNISSERDRAYTVQEAISKKRAIASERITLIHENNDPTGFIVVQPVFKNAFFSGKEVFYKDMASNLDGEELDGFIIGRMSAHDVMTQSLKGKQFSNLVIRLQDKTAAIDKRTMVTIGDMSQISNSDADKNSLRYNYHMVFAGQYWDVEVIATPGYVKENLPDGHILVLIFGLLVTIILVGYTQVLHRQHGYKDTTVHI